MNQLQLLHTMDHLLLVMTLIHLNPIHLRTTNHLHLIQVILRQNLQNHMHPLMVPRGTITIDNNSS